MSESSLLVQEYYKQNTYYRPLTDEMITFEQWNTICGDTITVGILIQDDVVIDYVYGGEPAQITKAAAEFLWEFVIGEKIEAILTRDADRVRSEGFEVSTRRVRSSVSALLGVRNCIHQYLDDGWRDEYEDVI